MITECIYISVLKKFQIKNVITCQGETWNPQKEFLDYIDEYEIDTVFVGEDSFVEVANPDNIIYRFFSAAKRLLVGTLAYYLTKYCTKEVVVVPAPVLSKSIDSDVIVPDNKSMLVS